MFRIGKEKTNKYISILELTCFFVLIYLAWWYIEKVINNFTAHFQDNYCSLLELFLLGLVSQVGLNIVPCMTFCRLKKLNIGKVFKLKCVSREQFILSLILFISFNGIALFLDNFMNLILSGFGLGYRMNNYVLAKDTSTLIVLILVAGIITPLCEELFYRGFLISSIERNGIRISIIYSAVCFSIMHTNPYRLSSLFIYSVFIGIIVHYTNSTLPGIVFHIFNNTVYEIGSYFTRGDLVTTSFLNGNKEDAGSISGKLIFYGIIFLICLILSCTAIRKLKNIWIMNNGHHVESDAIDNSKPSQKIQLCISMIIMTALFILKVSFY